MEYVNNCSDCKICNKIRNTCTYFMMPRKISNGIYGNKPEWCPQVKPISEVDKYINNNYPSTVEDEAQTFFHFSDKDIYTAGFKDAKEFWINKTKESINKLIDERIGLIDPQDIEGHIWLAKFKTFVNETKCPVN